jgi:hypothetical protein
MLNDCLAMILSQYSIKLLKIINKYLYSKKYEYLIPSLVHFVVFVLKYLKMIIFYDLLKTKKHWSLRL